VSMTGARLRRLMPKWLAGLGAGSVSATGVHGLAALVDPVPFLGELARRGVKAAVFEGASV
jgi:hypothetical protein